MRLKIVGLSILTLVYFGLSSWYYVCEIKNSCGEELIVEVKEEVPFSFTHGSDEVVVSSLTDSVLSSIESKLGDQNELILYGFYCEEEVMDSSNLGVLRAKSVLDLMDAEYVPRVHIASRMIESVNWDSSTLVDFKVLTVNSDLCETENGAKLYVDGQDDSITLSTKVEAYLMYVALENTDVNIDVIGHAYSADSEIDSLSGLALANFCKDVLIQFGCLEENIETGSVGRSEQLDSVDRRSQVEIIFKEYDE
ncbi:MAG: hypothetical protein ACPGTP_02145 [Bacteroidia bacterium]